MDPARQLAHLSLSVAEGVLTRTLDVVRLVDGLLLSTAQSNASDARSAEETWPAEETGDLTSAASALRARTGAETPVTRTPAARKTAAKKTPAKKTPAKKAAAKKTSETTAGPRKKSPATKTTAKRSPVKKATARKSTSAPTRSTS